MRRLPLTTTRSPISGATDEGDTARLPVPGHPYLHLKRRTASLARWLHTYLSMFSFVILLFFAVTGLTLNHAEWFDGQQRTTKAQGTLDHSWLRMADPKTVAKPEIVAYLQRTHGIKSDASDFQVDDEQCELSFKGPGYEADAIIDRDSGKYDLSVTRYGFAAVMNDLHKGRNTGKRWSELIDASAILMTLVSLTGLTLIFFLTKRRTSGLMLIVIGALICAVAYAIWVP